MRDRSLLHAYGAALLLVAALTATVGGMVLREFWHVAQRVAARYPSTEEEEQLFHRAVLVNTAVEQELGSLATSVGADRALVWQAHNSTVDLHQIPFVFVSNTYQWLAPGRAWDERWSQPIRLSSITSTLSLMWRKPEQPECVTHGAFDQALSEQAKQRLAKRGVERVYICPLLSPRGGPVGLISVEYLRDDGERPTDAVIELWLHDSAARVYRQLASLSPRA